MVIAKAIFGKYSSTSISSSSIRLIAKAILTPFLVDMAVSVLVEAVLVLIANAISTRYLVHMAVLLLAAAVLFDYLRPYLPAFWYIWQYQH